MTKKSKSYAVCIKDI